MELVAIILAIIVIPVLLFALIDALKEFRSELEYINQEIKRADKDNVRYWKYLRRRLWLKLFLPFIKD